MSSLPPTPAGAPAVFPAPQAASSSANTASAAVLLRRILPISASPGHCVPAARIVGKGRRAGQTGADRTGRLPRDRSQLRVERTGPAGHRFACIGILTLHCNDGRYDAPAPEDACGERRGAAEKVIAAPAQEVVFVAHAERAQILALLHGAGEGLRQHRERELV